MSLEFTRVRSIDQLLDALADPGARILCGGTDLLVKMRGGLAKPSRLLDVADLADLRGVTWGKDWVEIGAAVPYAELVAEPRVRDRLAILFLVLAKLGSTQIRNRGTLGGNLANASPAADSAIALFLLDAELLLTSRGGNRTVRAEEFLLGPGKTALGSGEFIRAVRVPIPDPRLRPFFHKVGRRKALTISIASVGALLRVERGRVREARLAAGSVAPTPLRLRRVESLVTGSQITPELLAQVQGLTRESVSPIDDVRASGAYRRDVTAELVARALEESLHA